MRKIVVSKFILLSLLILMGCNKGRLVNQGQTPRIDGQNLTFLEVSPEEMSGRLPLDVFYSVFNTRFENASHVVSHMINTITMETLKNKVASTNTNLLKRNDVEFDDEFELTFIVQQGPDTESRIAFLPLTDASINEHNLQDDILLMFKEPLFSVCKPNKLCFESKYIVWDEKIQKEILVGTVQSRRSIAFFANRKDWTVVISKAVSEILKRARLKDLQKRNKKDKRIILVELGDKV